MTTSGKLLLELADTATTEGAHEEEVNKIHKTFLCEAKKNRNSLFGRKAPPTEAQKASFSEFLKTLQAD